MVNRVKGVTPSMAKKIFLEPRRIMGSICERISAISRIVFEIFDHICGPFIYVNHNNYIFHACYASKTSLQVSVLTRDIL